MEEFRTLRSRLYQIREKSPLKKIMIASALRERVDSVSSNLAYVLVRQHGRRVFMIDGDVRKCHCTNASEPRVRPDCAAKIPAGEVDEKAVLQRGPSTTYFLIPGGRSVANPSELLRMGD